MDTGFISFLQNLWPFSSRKLDDLKLSDQIVGKLSIPDQTKQFVFVIREPESQSIIYILATQNLSEQSAIDAEFLIKEIRPDAVIAQVACSALTEVQEDEKNNSRENCDDNDQVNVVPTSSFGVIKGCFINKINKDKYESLAGNEVLKEIFGIGFYGHFLAAEKAAKEVGSSILLLYDNGNVRANSVWRSIFGMLEGSFINKNNKDKYESLAGGEFVNNFQALGSSSLVPQKMGSLALPSLKRLCLTNDLHSQMVKSLVSHSVSKLGSGSVSVSDRLGDSQPKCDYQAPSYAQTVYLLLNDLHDIFADLPSIGRAFAYAQKMLYKVDRGETVETQLLSEVCAFRIAIEGMRIGLNSAGRCPTNKMGNQISSNSGFSELSTEDKFHALFAKALRSQTKKFKSVVAIVDASSLAGLRKHWNIPLPPEVEESIDQFFTAHDENLASENVDRKGILSNKPVVAVGAGATAVLGASSLSKLGSASTFMKFVAFKVPVSLKLTLAQSQKAVAIALSKILGPSKVVIPGIGSSGVKTTSIMKATGSAEKIRTVAHSVITYAERTSISTMRTVFYEIMRKRRVRPIGFMPWATFGCSVATCIGLLKYGDGIECAVESVPAAPRIASLGRGLQSLHQASRVVSDSPNIREAIGSLLYSSKKVKVQ
ncbi:hypothetical protein BVC80_747g7 [Macleaya cordata]|uniref:Transmembrane protein n=1 Tax=Macleaya cordata TaxID=56857 RepID=A0A200QN40_MACCD|nr:hypothetical protein BVC80_747g7 [Macleaya cordata]